MTMETCAIDDGEMPNFTRIDVGVEIVDLSIWEGWRRWRGIVTFGVVKVESGLKGSAGCENGWQVLEVSLVELVFRLWMEWV